MLKKILSLLLTILMAVSMLTIVSFANSDMQITFDLTSDGKNEVVSGGGKTVEVVFSIIRTDTESSYSFSNFDAMIVYDRSFFEYQEGSAKMIRDKGDVFPTPSIEYGGKVIKAARNASPTDYYKGRVDFCKFTLKIKDGAEGSSVIKFDETESGFFDTQQQKVIPTHKSLIVTIGTPAEVNFKVSEKITTKDDVYVGMTFGEIKPENPTPPAGYKFDCWTLDGDPVNDDYEITGGETFVAKFSPTYKITIFGEYISGTKDYSLVLVDGDDTGYTFGGKDMYYVERYGQFGWVVEGALTVEQAQILVEATQTVNATTIEEGYDVNQYLSRVDDGTVDITDAGTVFGVYTDRISQLSGYYWEQIVPIVLASDVADENESDKYKVNITDFNAVIENYTVQP